MEKNVFMDFNQSSLWAGFLKNKNKTLKNKNKASKMWMIFSWLTSLLLKIEVPRADWETEGQHSNLEQFVSKLTLLSSENWPPLNMDFNFQMIHFKTSQQCGYFSIAVSSFCAFPSELQSQHFWKRSTEDN